MIAAVIGIALVLVGCQALQTGVPQMEPPSTDQVEAEQRKLDALSEP